MYQCGGNTSAFQPSSIKMDQCPVCPSIRISDHLRQILQNIKMVSTPFLFFLCRPFFYLTLIKAIWWVAITSSNENWNDRLPPRPEIDIFPNSRTLVVTRGVDTGKALGYHTLVKNLVILVYIYIYIQCSACVGRPFVYGLSKPWVLEGSNSHGD